ncbi:hypothetical protein EC968_006530 [Mortierella alpina]|nr:hypothetical protein EC968_006530 [Mortierella alpina]
MRIAAFIPAVLALTLFSATQAAPTGNSVDLLKRDRPDVDADVDAFVELHTKLVADVSTEISAYICADLDVEAKADANVLGDIVTAKVDIEKVRLSIRAKADAEVKAKVDAEIKAKVTADIEATVHQVIVKLCPLLEAECIEENAANIVADVNAKIFVNLKKVLVTIKAKIESHLRLRIKAIVEEVKVNLGIANVKISARVWIASNVDVLVKVWVKIWLKLCAKINVKALVKAL